MSEARWHSTLAYALVGESFDLGVQCRPDAEELARALSERGWDAPAVRAHALEERRAGRPWPHPLDADARAGMGAAQWFAALGRARAALGVDVLAERAPSPRTTLDADERRLMAEVPPHHGR